MQERHAERGSTALEVLRGVAKQWDLTMLGEDIDVLMAEQKINSLSMRLSAASSIGW